MRFIVLLYSSLLMACSAHAQDRESANFMINGCSEHLRTEGMATVPATTWGKMAGMCAGEVYAAMAMSTYLVPPFKFCPPEGVTIGQGIRVATAYANSKPARMHEPFFTLMLESFRTAWPCSRNS